MWLIKSLIRHVSSTLNDGQQNDDDEEEEGDVKDDAVDLVLVTGRIFDLITDAAAGTNANIHVEHIALRTHRVILQLTSAFGNLQNQTVLTVTSSPLFLYRFTDRFKAASQ